MLKRLAKDFALELSLIALQLVLKKVTEKATSSSASLAVFPEQKLDRGYRCPGCRFDMKRTNPDDTTFSCPGCGAVIEERTLITIDANKHAERIEG